MDDTILREEGINTKVKFAWAMIPLILVAVAVLRLNSGYGDSDEFAIFFVVGIAVVFAAGVIGAIIGERPNRFVSRGPYTRGQLWTNAPPQVVMPALMEALHKGAVVVEEAGGTRVVGRRKVSFGSWGSRVFVDLRPSADRPGLGVVTVAVRPSYPLQVTDWGRGIKTATKLLQAVPGIVDVRDPKAR